MKIIIVISSNENIIKTVGDACSSFTEDFDFRVKNNCADAISYINYELPEIKVLDYTSAKIDCDEIMRTIHDDPWLHYGGVMAVCSDRAQVKQLEMQKDANFISIQTQDGFAAHFGRMLRILWQNQQFLTLHRMQGFIGAEESGSFICGSDPFDYSFYTMFLTNHLFNTNRINEDTRMNLKVALAKLLQNAHEHGNLNISHEEKIEYQKQFGDVENLLRERARDPKYAFKQITLMYTITREKSSFSIRDEGNGFDWRKWLENGANRDSGISFIRTLVDDLEYNEKGTQASFSIKNQLDSSNLIPSVMYKMEKRHFVNRQIVCRQNEPSTDLFFIVSGRYAVYSNRKLMNVLTPSDVFIGEMAFLLNDRRSATVMAVGNGTLIKISKTEFLQLIKRNPHYGIFLSKMLAHRLSLQNAAVVKLSNKISRR